MRALTKEIKTHILDGRTEGPFSIYISQMIRLHPNHVDEINAKCTSKFSPENMRKIKKMIRQELYYMVEIDEFGWALFLTNDEMTDWEYTTHESDELIHPATLQFFVDEL